MDDHSLFRNVLAEFLSQQSNLRVKIKVDNCKDLLFRLKDNPIDILLLDIFIPHNNCHETIDAIHREYPDIKIIIVSICTDVQIISQLVDLGIHSFISKNDEPNNLLEAIAAVSEDRIYRNYLYTEALFLNKENNSTRENVVIANLSEREKEIIRLMWSEKTNKEIAKLVFLSPRSIEKIRQDLKEKLGIKSIAGVFKFALLQGIISIHNVSSNVD